MWLLWVYRAAWGGAQGTAWHTRLMGHQLLLVLFMGSTSVSCFINILWLPLLLCQHSLIRCCCPRCYHNKITWTSPTLQTAPSLPSKGWGSNLGILTFPLCTTHVPQYKIYKYIYIYVLFLRQNGHKNRTGAGKMAQWVKMLLTKPVDLSSVPGTNTVGEN